MVVSSTGVVLEQHFVTSTEVQSSTGVVLCSTE